MPDTKIIAPALEAITKSWYSGAVIEFTLSDGRRLTVSPNHIMLTARGWVRAQDILKSDKVISYSAGIKSVLESNPTNNNGIPSIEQVFTALIETQGVATASVPATTEHLKGDITLNTEIEVISTNSELWNKLDASKREMIRNIGFVGTGETAKIALDSFGSIAKCLLTLGLASDRIMRSLSIKPLFFWRSLTCRELISLRTPSDYDARLKQTAINHRATNAETLCKGKNAFSLIVKAYNFLRVNILALSNGRTKFNAVFSQYALNRFGFAVKEFRKLANTFSSEVQLDDIVNIRRFNYVGHVYDTSSMVTLYTANGIITSNCHCTTAPWDDPDDYEAWLNFLESGGTTAEWDAMRKEQSIDYAERRRQRLAERQATNSEDTGLKTIIDAPKGTNKEAVRDVESVLKKLERELGGDTIKGLSVKFTTGLKGVYAKFDDSTNTLLIPKGVNPKQVAESLQKENARYHAKWKTEKDYHATETFTGLVWHELGHAVDVSTGQRLSKSLSLNPELDEASVKVSAYAGTTQNVRVSKRSEAWAENFAAYMDGGKNKDKVPPEIRQMIEEYFREQRRRAH